MLIKSGKKKKGEQPLLFMKRGITIGCFLMLATVVVAQPYASWTKTELTLSNAVVERTIQLPQGILLLRKQENI